MPSANDSLAAVFRELVELATLDEADPNSFRVRAYERALETIVSHRGDLGLLSEKELVRLEGIGPSTARKIREFFESGRVAKVEELRAKYPPGFRELARIPGLGPKTLRRLQSELGVNDLEGLRAAVAARKLREMKGLGEKAEEKIRLAISRMGTAAKENRRPIAEAMPIARELVAALEALPQVERAQCCGSLRRLRETVADVDIVVASREPAAVRDAFVAMRAVRDVIGSGETKTSVRTATGLQVDLRIVDPRSFGAACQYFTGSKAHNIRLRQRALERGWTLNEYGLTDTATGETIASETEEAVYRALGLPLIPPPMREDRGEIERADAGEPLPLLGLGDVRGDLHVHTTLSGDGRSPLEEVVAAAAARGYEYLAITDHAENLYMNGAGRPALERQRAQVDGLRGRHPAMALLHGAELNIGRDGSLDYDVDFRRTLDWCVAGVHSHFDLSRDEQTRRVLAAMEDETVHAIAHLTGRRIGHRQGIDLDVDAVLRKAEETGTALEINGALGRLDLSSEVLYRAQGMDVVFVISTDSHHVREMERMEWGVRQAMRGFVDPGRVLNLRPRESFLAWVAGRRG
jgi:DNA polymerase (family 10)